MKNKWIALSSILVVSCMALSGCSLTDNLQIKLRDWLSNQMIEKSGITEEENYVQAQKNGEEGLLDENGRLTETVELPTEVTETGSIHITFANNDNVAIVYYSDKEKTQVIDTSEYYLNPGSSIFVSDALDISSYSDHYVFSGFRFIEYDQNGNRTGETELIKEEDGVIHIPTDYSGTELSIEPVGYYEPRAISLKAYWIDASGKEIVIDDGTWMINDEVYNETETEIHSGINYTVKYEYDPEKYYFVETQGELFSNDEQKGAIQFKEVEAINGVGSFRIRLHPYTSVNIVNNDKKIESITVTGRNNIDVDNKSILIEKLRPGDELSVVLDKDYKLTTTQKTLDRASSDVNKFDIAVSENDQGQMDFTVTKWNSKTISVAVAENGFWDKLKNNYLSWVPFLNKEEVNTVLTINTGENVYTYSDLLNAKTVKMSERDNLIINIDKEKVEGFSFVITVNNWKPITINSKSEEFSYSYSYDDISEIKIDLIED